MLLFGQHMDTVQYRKFLFSSSIVGNVFRIFANIKSWIIFQLNCKYFKICAITGNLNFLLPVILRSILEEVSLLGQPTICHCKYLHFFVSLFGVSWNLCQYWEFVIFCYYWEYTDYMLVYGVCPDYLEICVTIGPTDEHDIMGNLIVQPLVGIFRNLHHFRVIFCYHRSYWWFICFCHLRATVWRERQIYSMKSWNVP